MTKTTRTLLGLAIVCGFLAGAGVAGAQGDRGDPAGADQPVGLQVQVEGGQFLLSLEGRPPFHRTANRISSQHLVPAPGTTLILALWDEQVDGQLRPHYGISRDGLTFSRPRPTSYAIRLRHDSFDPVVGISPVPPLLQAQPDSELYIVQFVVQPMQEFVEAVTRLGGTVGKYIPHHAHIVRMGPQVREAVQALPYVRWVGPCHPAYRLEEPLAAGLAGEGPALPTQRYRIKVFEKGPAQKNAVANRIAASGGVVEQLGVNGTLFEATLNADQLLQVAGMNEVAFVDRWSPPRAMMNNVRVVGGADYLESVAGYTGQGVVGEVMDNGCLTTHQDFSGRITVRDAPVDVEYHGTATFGIVFGSGEGSSSARGLLPEAQGIFSSWNYGDRYDNTLELVSDPYNALFQSNSWGFSGTPEYTGVSSEMDEIVFDMDIVILHSQGNTGDQNAVEHAWGKNVVGVGGVRHYDDQDLDDDAWAGTGSTGPAADGRIQPDLCYYYDSIRTTSSSGGYTSSMGGTSAACPETAGHFGLFFQMWADGVFRNPVSGGTVFEERPHAATARAAIINTAVEYSFAGTGHDLTRTHQGWGLANVQNLYDHRNSIFIVDETDILEEFESIQYDRTCAGGDGPLRVTLVYTDRPGVPFAGVHRINDLTLKVTSPSAVVYYGNNGLLEGNWSTSGGSANTIDTVENVFIEDPEAGDWTIEVLADEINEDGHVETPENDADFALVVTGCFFDCNFNDLSDQDDIDQGTSPDCNTNRIPDECEIDQDTPGGSYFCTVDCNPDCNTNGVPDECDTDCNDNQSPDDCDVAAGTSNDCNDNVIPDECETDCNANEIPDDCDIAAGTSADTDGSEVPDECEAPILYVHQAATGGNHGATWADAYNDLQSALRIAAAPGTAVTEIWVAAGTYRPDGGTGDRSLSFELISGLGIYGGYAGGETDLAQRDPVVNVCVLSGDLNGDDGPNFVNNGENSYHVVTAGGTDATAVLDGFIVTGGNADGDDFPHFNGGGILNDDGSPTVTRCAVVGNCAVVGGGLYNDEGAPVLTNCALAGNRAVSSGGGFYTVGSGAHPLLEQCTFSGNTAGSDGGGLYNIGGGADVTLTNCSLARNAAGAHGGGVRSFYAGVTTLTNCILWANSDAGGTDESTQIKVDGTAAAVNYTCIQYLTGGLGGVGNISGSPWFIDLNGPDNRIGTADDNLRRGAGSACTDAGDNSAASQPTDADDRPRFVDDPMAPDIGAGTPPLVDMGPYEYQEDCNTNGIIDSVDLDAGTSADCDDNGVPDECQPIEDCNTNSVQDICDIAAGTSNDCNTNRVPDECEPSCNDNAVPDECDIAAGTSPDCNDNAVPDECDIAAGTSADCTSNGTPDECEPDCNSNGLADTCDIDAGTSIDGNSDGTPDECQGLLQAHSVWTHGGAGEFALLVYEAGASSANVEPRLGGAGDLRVTFEIEMDPVTATDPVNVSIVGLNSGPYNGPVNLSLDETGKVVIIEPGQVLPDADCYTVDLTGMTSQWGASPRDRTFMFATLVGDATRDGSVSSVDASGIKQRLGLAVTQDHSKYDINHDGSISTTDKSSVKQRLGNTAPDCP